MIKEKYEYDDIINLNTKLKTNRIDVVCRFRPQIRWEIEKGSYSSLIQIPSQNSCVIDSGKKKKSSQKEYFFNRVFDEYSSQRDIYECIGEPLIDQFFNGENSTIISYGQTTSGKTYTMMNYTSTEREKGITPRVIENIFKKIEEEYDEDECEVKIAYFEIYMEKVNDLLAFDDSKYYKNKKLKIKEDVERKLFYVDGLVETTVTSSEETMNYFKYGNLNKKKNHSSHGKSSSRSHTIFQIVLIKNTTGSISKATFVDLAGSERILSGKRNSRGKCFKEAKSINKSLSVLSKVISRLSKSKSFIPYRESVLTKILKDSFSKFSNSKTTIIINCSSSDINVEETLSSIRFAENCKLVRNKLKKKSNFNEKNIALKNLIEKQKKTIHIQETKLNFYKSLMIKQKDRIQEIKKQKQNFELQNQTNQIFQYIEKIHERDDKIIELEDEIIQLKQQIFENNFEKLVENDDQKDIEEEYIEEEEEGEDSDDYSDDSTYESDTDDDNIGKCGEYYFLENNKWKKRWITIENKQIKVFSNKKNIREKILIDVNNYELKIIDKFQKRDVFSISLVGVGEHDNFYLKFPNRKERNEFSKCIYS